MHSRTGNGPESDRLSALSGIVVGMARRIQDRTYRSTAELMRAIRDEHVLTQDELAGRTGLSRYQLCRWEKGGPRADLGKGAQIDVPVVPLAALRESGMHGRPRRRWRSGCCNGRPVRVGM